MDGVARGTSSYATNTQATPLRTNTENRTPLLNGQVADTSSMNWLVNSHDSQLGAGIHREITEGRLNAQQSSAGHANYHIALARADGSRAPVKNTAASAAPISMGPAAQSARASRQEIGQQLQIISQQLKAEMINFQVAFANLSHRPVNDQDRAPFRELERLHAELFSGGPIEYVPEGRNVLVPNVRDVDIDEFDVINSKDGCQGIGTSGLGPCIAVCARGMDKEGLPVLGVYHHSGLGSPEETMSTLDKAMRDKGALHIKYSLVGGRIMPKEEEAGSYADEQSFLELKGSYPVEGARLHVSEGEEDAHTGEDNSVNVVLMPNRILYGRDTLYR